MSTTRSLTITLTLFGLVSSVAANPLVRAPAQKAPADYRNTKLVTQQSSIDPTADAAQVGITDRSQSATFEQQPDLVNPAALTCNKLTDMTTYTNGSIVSPEKLDPNSASDYQWTGSLSESDTHSTQKQAKTTTKKSASWMTRLFFKKRTTTPTKTRSKGIRKSSEKMTGDNHNAQIDIPSSAPIKAKAKQPVVLRQSRSKLVNQAFATSSTLDSVEVRLTEEVPTPAGTLFLEREKIIFRPTVVDVNRYGQPVLRPNVQLANRQPRSGHDSEIRLSNVEQQAPGEAEVIIPDQWSAPIVDGPYEQYSEQCVQCAPRLGPFQELCCRIRARLNGPCSSEPGIGTERVIHAISFIDTTQPQNSFRLRLDAAYDFESPDRAEYFWAKIGGRGPSGLGGETNVNYQDLRAYLEIGGKKFSVGTDVPIRILAPDTYGNTSGLGDINITTKTVFLDGKQWQLANLLRTYIPSGDTGAGLGVGHASIEPGFAGRYKWSDITYLHGDLKYWIPLGADQLHGGEVLIYGIGVSHVWRDSDSYAVMPTLEIVGYSFLDGQVTPPGIGATPIEVDGLNIVNIHPGIRWVWDRGSDCGVKELGLFGGFSMTSDSLYEEMLRLEYRWTW